MSQLKGACIIGQSGGPTSVINASAYGVIRTALDSGCITKVYGAAHGIKGVLDDVLYDMGQEDAKELEYLLYTPSSALGSCRYKLKDSAEDDSDYKRILEIFKKYDVRYFFYNGGNDSMDTCNKISKYMQSVGYECRIMGVPKTIDNDLFGTDHCPGYASAAKYVATTCMEIYRDARVYDTGMVCVIEIMGRHAGWLTAASSLANISGEGPDLIYLPERDFDLNKFVEDVKAVYARSGKCIAAVSEGIHDSTGKLIAEYGAENAPVDAFGHKQLGGLASHVMTATGGVTSGLLIDGQQAALGEFARKFGLFVMHSKIFAEYQKMGLVDYNKYTITNVLQREVELPTINGLIVIVNDRGTSHVIEEGASEPKKKVTIYDCYLFGQGCFLEATPAVTTPDYTDYNPELGGGTDILYNTRSWILHPNGVSFLADNISGETPTDAEFTAKANWALRFEHQNVRIGKIEIRADKLGA